jgi:uracil-DNA glycosylase
MVQRQRDSAVELIPHELNLTTLRAAAAKCQACDLWKDATQTVFGAGTARAKLMSIGEQPGNDEGEPPGQNELDS